MSKAKDVITTLDSILVFDEGGYSRLMQVMSGLVPIIKTFAIITWENPLGKKASDEQNKEANKQFKSLLKKGHYSYRHITGKYNDFENPFIIFNIGLREAKYLGFGEAEFKQESIIYGKRFVDKSNNTAGVIMKMIFHDNRQPRTKRVWHYLDDKAQMYSEYKGRKFEIPFFDDEDGKDHRSDSKQMTFKDGKKQVIEDCRIYPKEFFSEVGIKKIDEMVDIVIQDRSGRFLYEHRGELAGEMWKRKFLNGYLENPRTLEYLKDKEEKDGVVVYDIDSVRPENF